MKELMIFVMGHPMIIDEKIIILIGSQNEIKDIVMNKYDHKDYKGDSKKAFGLVSSSSEVNIHFVCVFLDNIRNHGGNSNPYKTLIHELEHLNTRIRYELGLVGWKNHFDETFVRWWTSFMTDGIGGQALRYCSNLIG